MSLPHLFQPPSPISPAAPIRPTLTLTDAIAIIVGIVIGAGIFETPSLVAASVGNSTQVVLLWLLGGSISLIGALCYAELATTYPHPGGNYIYLARAFGRPLAFLFVWSRLIAIQPGSIVLLAFVFGDYASQVFSLGSISASLYAIAAIVIFTGFNLLGIQQGKWAQKLLTSAEILGLLLIVGIGFLTQTSLAPTPTVTNSNYPPSIGLALVFVLLSYGGWNEAAYISAEIRNSRRNLVRSLLWSIGIISGVYLLINLALLKG